MNTVFLHIGVHKTGSSSIQYTLKRNAVQLRQRGLIYPEALPANHSHFFASAFRDRPELYHANKRENLSLEDIREKVRKTTRNLTEELKSVEDAKIVLSAEDACTIEAHRIPRIKEFFGNIIASPTYKIIMYVRHPIGFVSSAIQENVKGNGMTAGEAKKYHIKNAKDKYKNIIKMYQDVFGDDALVVKSFEQAVESGAGLVEDFLSTCGVDCQGINEERVNEGISDEIVEFLSFYRNSASGVDESVRGSEIPEKDRNVIFSLKGTKGTLLNPSEEQDIMSLASSDMEFLDDNFHIDYKYRPDKSRNPRRFSRPFLVSLSEALPQLSLPVRISLLEFLLLRNTGPGPGNT